MISSEDEGKFESRLRCRFREALRSRYGGDVVDVLISILREDYILVLKEHRSCLDCVNCHDNTKGGVICSVPYYCMKYEFGIDRLSSAEDCLGFLGAVEEARKSMAHLHKELNPDALFYK